MEQTVEAGAGVRDALLAVGFTAEGVLAAVGADAFAALGRGEVVPARHALDQALAEDEQLRGDRLQRGLGQLRAAGA